ncbi:MAG: alkaline phosphatase, partial [Bacteroidota bacterium]
GSKTPLNIEKFPIVGFQKTHALNFLVTDSAAGATAMACGTKTYIGAIGMNGDTIPCKSILEIAEENKLATGVVVTSTMVHATPASFMAHQPLRGLYEPIAADIVESGVDFIVGGGKKYFDRRAMDDRNLYKELQQKGYQVNDYFRKNLERLTVDPSKNFAYFTADSDPLAYWQGRKYLPYASKLAVNFLEKKNENGFFLLVEGSYIDWAGHENDFNYLLSEIKDFDRAIGEVLSFASRNRETLVIVTADHETGGLAINPGSRFGKLKPAYTEKKGRAHTATMVPVFAYGPGAEQFSGIFDNTQMFYKLLRSYGFQVPSPFNVYPASGNIK